LDVAPTTINANTPAYVQIPMKPIVHCR